MLSHSILSAIEFPRWIWSSLLPPSSSISFRSPPILSRSAADLAAPTPVSPLLSGGRLVDVATTRILLFRTTTAAEVGVIWILTAGFLLIVMLFCIKEEPSKRWRSSIREFSRIEKEASSLPREMEDSSKIVCISERAEEFALS